MNIYFVGQTTISPTAAQGMRIAALSEQLTQRGHSVTAFTATKTTLRRAAHMRVRHLPSLLPDSPGGWLYTLISVLIASIKRADVIHITSWKAAALMPLAAIVHPHTTMVWTIDAIPASHTFTRKLVAWLAARFFDGITTPTRALQYQFRNTFNVLPVYIPDGYVNPVIQPIPASFWKLRKNMYTLALCDSPASLTKLCKAYKTTKSRKKVVVLVQNITAAHKRIQKKYSFLRIIQSNTPRQRASLIAQAGSIIFAEATTSGQELLLAMESGAPLIAVNHPLYQEIAGTTMQFFSADDTEYFGELLTSVFAGRTSKKQSKSTVRAKAHFTWQRIFEDYEILYHYPLVRRVPVDSVRANLQSPVPLG